MNETKITGLLDILDILFDTIVLQNTFPQTKDRHSRKEQLCYVSERVRTHHMDMFCKQGSAEPAYFVCVD